MTEDIDYLSNYKPNTLHVNPDKRGAGAYTTLIEEGEELLFEQEITDRFRLALSMFYVNQREDYNSFKLTKLKYQKKRGWFKDGEIYLSVFDLSKIREFIELLSSINFKDAKKSKISLNSLNLENLKVLLKTDKCTDLIKQLAETPELSEDIFALAHKKEALVVFEKLLTSYEDYKHEYASLHELKKLGEENIWQHFFEDNPWIFGHGLNYVFLDKDGKKLETVTTGYNHNQSGNRVDALMKTKAAISQYVLIEIKTPSIQLLQKSTYRSGIWTVSKDVTDAIGQIQKTVFDFITNQTSKVQCKDEDGNLTGQEVYKIQPKSYLIIGNLSQLELSDEKFICFQLFRSSLITPEILTFDELFERAKCIVQTLSNTSMKSPSSP